MSVHKSLIKTSDFLAYSVIIVAIILEFVLPTDLYVPRLVSVTAGIILIIIAWVTIFTAKYQFKIHNQKSGPNNETTELITTGLFRYTRNPIYLGVVLIAPAIGFMIDSIWLIVAIIPTIFFLQYFLILPEERYLIKIFGNKYTEYCKRVGRWI